MSTSPVHGIPTRVQVLSLVLSMMDLIGTTLTSLQIMIQALIMIFATTMVIQHPPRTTLTERPQAALPLQQATMGLVLQVQRPRPPLWGSNSSHAALQMFVNQTPWVTSVNRLISIPIRGVQVMMGKRSPARAH